MDYTFSGAKAFNQELVWDTSSVMTTWTTCSITPDRRRIFVTERSVALKRLKTSLGCRMTQRPQRSKRRTRRSCGNGTDKNFNNIEERHADECEAHDILVAQRASCRSPECVDSKYIHFYLHRHSNAKYRFFTVLGTESVVAARRAVPLVEHRRAAAAEEQQEAGGDGDGDAGDAEGGDGDHQTMPSRPTRKPTKSYGSHKKASGGRRPRAAARAAAVRLERRSRHAPRLLHPNHKARRSAASAARGGGGARRRCAAARGGARRAPHRRSRGR